MINSIHLHNFQSHPDTMLELSPGINAIIGSSDSGKTSILRGLYWAILNRPSGEAFISHWTKDKKGIQKEPTSVTIHKGESKLVRFRDKDHNSYEINGKQLDAIRTNVPEEVPAFFNLSEVNIQKQLDSPFLLDTSSGEVARFFNKVIKLEEIDLILSLADKKKRECKDQTQGIEARQLSIEQELKGLEWVESALQIVEKCSLLNDKIIEKTKMITQQKESLNQFSMIKTTLNALPPTQNIEILITKSEDIIKESSNININLIKFASSIAENKKFIQQIRESESLLNLETPLDRAIKLLDKIKDTRNLITKQDNSIREAREIRQKMAILSDDLPKLEALYPTTCPACGKPWEADKC